MADNRSAFSCAQGRVGPIRRAWPYGGVARHGPEGGGDQLPIWSAMDIIASARPSYRRRRNGVYIISVMDVTPTRSSLSSRKEGEARLHWASGKAVPATSADLVNCPQDFPLGSRGDGRRCSVLNFNVRPSLFVGPRLFVIFPQGVQGAPLRRHAQLPASDPCGRTYRNFATWRTTFSTVPSQPDAGPMAPWQEISQTLPPVRSTWLSRQPTTSKMMLVFWISLFRVSTLVPDGTF